jgi:hypothetical protein
LVPRLTRAQLMKAVRTPARVFGREVSDALAERIINDSFAFQDELPVLQHALMRTWLAAKSGAALLDLDDYKSDRVGTVEDALNVHGEDLVGEKGLEPRLTSRQRELVEVVLKRLTLDTGEESTRAPAALQELADVAGVAVDDADLVSVIERLRAPDCQFLSPPRPVPLEARTEIDLTHEAILRRWARLKEWAAEECRDSATYRRLLDVALAREVNPESETLWREPQHSAQRSSWNRRNPGDAWAKPYHQEVGKLTAAQSEHIVDPGTSPPELDH